MHALLEGFVQDSLIENQSHRLKTDKIIARTLFFSKNQKLHDTLFTRKFDQRTEIKLAKTFAEEIKPILKTWFSQTWNFANKTEPILETLQNQPRTKAEEKNLRRSDLTKNMLKNHKRQLTRTLTNGENEN